MQHLKRVCWLYRCIFFLRSEAVGSSRKVMNERGMCMREAVQRL